ncbi:MAG: hypothetical protein HQ483_11590 [Rhodospirillales bacterium]|nr:hypothetical protein [Rhodospirillales bacterium]
MTLFALAVLSVSELIYLYTGFALAGDISRLTVCAVCLCVIPKFTLREWALGAMAVGLAVGVWLYKPSADAIYYGLDRAAFFGAFIYLITLLKEAAIRSPSVLELGHYLTNQPPGRRYFATAIGGHFLGVLLNFGAVSLLAPLIQRGARAEPIVTAADEKRAQIREQRQISALLRGFSWMILWSPTALTQAVLFSTLPGVDLLTVSSLGGIAAIIMILIGRAEERFRWRHIVITRPPTLLHFPKRSAFNLLMVCVFLIGSTYLIVYVVDVSTARALMLMAPLVMIGWVLAQNTGLRLGHSLLAAGQALSGIFRGSAGPLASNTYALATAGFIGETAAHLAPVHYMAEHANLDQIPAWLFLVSLPLLISICGQVALSPLMVVVFLSAIMRELPALPADPSHIVFAMGAGWALSMTASPNATATILISGTCGIPPTTLTWRWNGVYALLCFIAFSAMFYVITGGQ